MSMTMENLDERLDQMAADMRSLAAKAECHHMEIGDMKASFSWNGGSRVFLFFGTGKSGYKISHKPSTACAGEQCND